MFQQGAQEGHWRILLRPQTSIKRLWRVPVAQNNDLRSHKQSPNCTIENQVSFGLLCPRNGFLVACLHTAFEVEVLFFLQNEPYLCPSFHLLVWSLTSLWVMKESWSREPALSCPASFCASQLFIYLLINLFRYLEIPWWIKRYIF